MVLFPAKKKPRRTLRSAVKESSNMARDIKHLGLEILSAKHLGAATSVVLLVLCYFLSCSEASASLLGMEHDYGTSPKFVCIPIPPEADPSCYSPPGVPHGPNGHANGHSGRVLISDEAKATILHLRESLVRQKETILDQRETIRELTAKLTLCEGFGGHHSNGHHNERHDNHHHDDHHDNHHVNHPDGHSSHHGSYHGREHHFSHGSHRSEPHHWDSHAKHGSFSPEQTGKTLQTLKERLENLQARNSSSSYSSSLRELLQRKINALEEQLRSYYRDHHDDHHDDHPRDNHHDDHHRDNHHDDHHEDHHRDNHHDDHHRDNHQIDHHDDHGQDRHGNGRHEDHHRDNHHDDHHRDNHQIDHHNDHGQDRHGNGRHNDHHGSHHESRHYNHHSDHHARHHEPHYGHHDRHGSSRHSGRYVDHHIDQYGHRDDHLGSHHDGHHLDHHDDHHEDHRGSHHDDHHDDHHLPRRLPFSSKETSAHNGGHSKLESVLSQLHHGLSEHGGHKKLKSSSAFLLDFPMRTNYMYARMKRSPVTELFALTVCLRLKVGAGPGVGTPFSYAVPGQANELVLIEWGANPLELLVNDKAVTLPVTLSDRKWHHVCVTWATRDGTWEVYQDGARKGSGQNLAAWHAIKPGGIFLLGQEQDTLGGGFDVTQSFTGELSDVHVWSRVLTPSEIFAQASCATRLLGDVASWEQEDVEPHGGLAEFPFDACH